VGTRGFWFKASAGKKPVRSYIENKLGMVVHTCNPTYTRDRDRRIGSKANPRKSMKPCHKNKPGVVVHTCNSSYLSGRGKRVMV
jgi:hypothetical protein